MKSNVKCVVLSYQIYCLVIIATGLLTEPVFALRMTDMPEEIRTKIKEPRERTISLKLPLLQPTFHWTFMNREDLLSGKLLLRIIREEQTNEIVIFENGQFAEGWEAIPLPSAPERGEIYFGFISTLKYPTAPGDKLELELTVQEDLPGIGAIQSGILPSGKYTSKGTYSGLIDDYNTSILEGKLAEEGKISVDEQETLLNKLRSMYEKKAFLESWDDQWPLKITSQKGWLPKEKAASVKAMLENLDQQTEAELEEESTPASTDSIDDNSSRSYLWCWISIPVVGLFVVIFLLRFLNKP